MFARFVQNQNIVKIRLVLPSKARNAEILSGGLMIILVDIECTDYSSVETSRHYSMPKPENFLNYN